MVLVGLYAAEPKGGGGGEKNVSGVGRTGGRRLLVFVSPSHILMSVGATALLLLPSLEGEKSYKAHTHLSSGPEEKKGKMRVIAEGKR